MESHTEEAVQPLYAKWAAAQVPVSATILAALGHRVAPVGASPRPGGVRGGWRPTREVCDVIGRTSTARTAALEQVLGDMLVESGW